LNSKGGIHLGWPDALKVPFALVKPTMAGVGCDDQIRAIVLLQSVVVDDSEQLGENCRRRRFQIEDEA
jgi:hypothetical protein